MSRRGCPNLSAKELGRVRELRERGLDLASISRLTGVSQRSICRHFGRETRPWSRGEVLRLESMRERGLTYPEIASELGRTAFAARNRYMRLRASA